MINKMFTELDEIREKYRNGLISQTETAQAVKQEALKAIVMIHFNSLKPEYKKALLEDLKE